MIGKQLHISASKALDTQIAAVENREGSAGVVVKKPKLGTGFWTSTWREETRDSSWVEYHKGVFGTLDELNWYLLTPKEQCDLFIIDSLRDLHKLLEVYEWRYPGFEAYMDVTRAIDFEKMSQDYDGIHLTEEGQYHTHLTFPANLYGWDCESTLWFRWCFTQVERIEASKELMKDEIT